MKKYWKNIYHLQLLVNIAIGIYFIFWLDPAVDAEPVTKYTDIIFTGIVLLLFLLNFIWTKNKYISFSVRWASIITLPMIFLYFLSGIFDTWSDNFSQHNLYAAIYMLLICVLFIPIAETVFKQVISPLGKMISVLFLFVETVTLGYYDTFSKLSPIIKAINDYHVASAVASFLVFQIILDQKMSLRKLKNPYFSFLILILIILFNIWLAFFEQFFGNAHSYAEAFWDWGHNFDPTAFTFFEFNFSNVFRSLYAGILEEGMRVLNIIMLLVIFKNTKYRLSLSVFISSLIFALLHFNLLFDPSRDLISVIQQVIVVFGVGCLWAVTYLYTGQLWLNVLLHTFFDYIAFSTTPLAHAALSPLSIYYDGFVEAIFLALIPILFTIFMFFGKRKQTMLDNADQLIQPQIED
ncbi:MULTISPECIES: CPBP family intramembrane glutamic endopeptidase [Lactobacillus]|uniref:CPBP family intramembrane metalloprotease n=1 Tax=Lactobacillus xujianguonis TaxID=2495899 RepID=A0A437SX03_9LACO|nr:MULTISPECIES: CPBP family intramembrane glutamic endopeptidase [Lactobacillus]RVU71453.1 CPBP family intramembrane metalloprotease [Lactobacillus xujianguonis]RVU73676.1 CPBP family intramembrane metalloprotease [Lactobacillus xujianguonis]